MKAKETSLEKLGLRIRVNRVAKRWSQEDLAEHANINMRSVSLIENGISDVKYTTLCKIAKALGIKLTSLIEEK